jgi:NTP pyrophosphatase (non-canonical NTP hydrolase)
MRQKRNNKRQTLRSTRLRLEEAYEDLAAMRRERDELKKELDAAIAAGYEEP